MIPLCRALNPWTVFLNGLSKKVNDEAGKKPNPEPVSPEPLRHPWPGELQHFLIRVDEGRGGDGQSYFYGALLGRIQDGELRNKIAEYDRWVMDYEVRLSRARGNFSFKYFQYLSLLFTEIFFDRLTENLQKFQIT